MTEKEKNREEELRSAVGRVEDHVEAIEEKAEEIPQPADAEVMARLQALASDKDDLVERFERLNSGTTGSDAESEALKTLAERLGSEAKALLHETEFLSMGARTTVDLILEAATRVADAVRNRSSGSGT